MKKILLFILMMTMIGSRLIAQSYSTELNYLSQYVQRMYNNAPFQGARVISDIDKCYLISVVSEQAAGNDYAIQRKAEVKAMRFANEYLNGVNVSSNTILHTEQTSDGHTREEIEDFIESRSMGYIQQMQVISTFVDGHGKRVFVFCKELPMPDKKIDKSKGKKGKRRKNKF